MVLYGFLGCCLEGVKFPNVRGGLCFGMFEVLLCFFWFVFDVGFNLGYKEQEFLDFVHVLYDLFV